MGIETVITDPLSLGKIPLLPGTRKIIDGVERVFYDGYWIRYYHPPADTLKAKRQLITALTRRLFNHVEHGINIPGWRLAHARQAYDNATDPARKRVNGAMLAGALFNRASDIISKLVEIQEMGVEILPDNALLRECGRCLQEALTLGRLVLHRSGEEGIDELWGEPLHAFSIPVDDFYESRYLKIASTLREVDHIGQSLTLCLREDPDFQDAIPLISRVIDSAHKKLETLQTDDLIFLVWPEFVVAGEQLTNFRPPIALSHDLERVRHQEHGLLLISQGWAILNDVSRARTPMPKTTQSYIERLEAFRACGTCPPLPTPSREKD
ncbi:MAG: hypothetical protein G3H99_08020 [Ferrovum sp.]|nr:hypothetical protein [Ferrovum sp.]NDU87821.1 hypothetical protein [Ferrovum sp.]